MATDLLGRTLDAVETYDARRTAIRRVDRAGRQRPALPEPVAQTPARCGSASRPAGSSTAAPDTSTTNGWAGRRPPGARCSPISSGCPCRCPRTSTPWPAPNCCWACVRPAASSLYVYARETVGYALVIDGRVRTPGTGPGTIAHLPAHSELLGGSGPTRVDGQ